jgi:hypothetical protein
MRPHSIFALLSLSAAVPAGGQATGTAPLALNLPLSTRAAALGNAGVTGRDDDVLFYNPAQLAGSRGGFNTTVARYGSSATLGALTASFTGGPLTLGWGVQAIAYSTAPDTPYPFTPRVLTNAGAVEALSLVAAVGGAMTFKGFKIGIAGKYAEDRLSSQVGVVGAAGYREHGTFLADVGVSHPLVGGVAGLAVQNIGRGWTDGSQKVDVPLQGSLGWSITQQAGQLDLGFATQVTARQGWLSPGGGVEIGYGWIEGYSAVLRAGIRRPESNAERPFGFGGTFNADRLSLDYAMQFLDGMRTVNRLTVRWR